MPGDNLPALAGWYAASVGNNYATPSLLQFLDGRPLPLNVLEQATMSLIAHLTELRNRILKAGLAILVATAIAFWWYGHGLGDFIRAPYCGLPEDLRYAGDDAGGCGLLITNVFGGVFIRLKVSFLAGVVLSAPFWLYQLWAFITPGLKRNEKRYGVGFGDVLVFGDMPNDLPMLAAAQEAGGRAVAVANAHPAVRALTAELTSGHEVDGVARYLEAVLGDV